MAVLEETNQVSTSPKKLKEFIRHHPLISFFSMAYGFSWILSIPFILSEWGILHGNYQIIFVLKSFGPFLAAYIITGILEGKEGILRLRQRIIQKQAGWQWYLLILLGIPLLIMAGVIIQPGAMASFQGFKPILLASYPLTFIAVLFAGGPLGEEPGWRGFALPRLQHNNGPFRGTLLLGFLWTCWHLPDFLISAQGGGPGTGFVNSLINFPIFLVLIISIAIILTWIFNLTRESIFIALLAHASVNTPQVVLVPLFPAVDTASLNLAALIAFGIPALLILILTHGQLGYQPTLIMEKF
jgi:membrane protease YdiL (CAAX protease family)